MAEQVHNPLEGQRPELTINLHDGSDELVSIIVVHKDSPEYLNICLQSITVTSYNNNYELIVVDNASDKETQDYLEEVEASGVKVIRNNKNLYWAKAANQGANAASKNSNYLVFLHPDVVVLNPGWLDILISVSNAQNAGMVGLELSAYSMQSQKIDFIQEWCMLVTRECWQETGPFSEELEQIGAPFIFSFKAQQKGYNPQVMKNPICHHYRVFNVNINEFEKFTEQAMVTIPQLLRDFQSEGLKARK